MKRVGSVIALAPGASKEYTLLHRTVPVGVLEAIRRAGIGNYSIFRHESLLFAYYEHEGEDIQGDLAAMGRDEETRRWWGTVAPLQRTLRTRSDDPWWVEMEEVFHVD